jgi:hypothetical protein
LSRSRLQNQNSSGAGLLRPPGALRTTEGGV